MLFELLDKLPNYLNPGGKVAILSFHSGEDLKKAFKHFYNIYSQINGPLIPSKDEVYHNPRARSQINNKLNNHILQQKQK